MNQPGKGFSSEAAAMVELTDLFLDQISKLAELHEAGILTDEEFSARKSELLARL